MTVSIASPLPASPPRGEEDERKPGAWWRRNSFTLLLFAAVIPYLFCLDGSPLTDTDEAMYAAMGKHMATGGSFLRPTLAQGTWLDKPPLALWLEALAMKMIGLNTVAVRLPSVLLALVAATALYWAARRGLGVKVARLASLFFLTTPAIAHACRDARFDMVFVGCLTLACAGFFALLDDRHAQTRTWQYGAALLAAMGLSGATLTKGLSALIVPALALVIAAILSRQWRLLWRLRPLFVTAVVVAFVGAYFLVEWRLFGSSFIQEQIFRSQFSRYLYEDRTHYATTPGFYLHTFLWAGFPWSLVLYGSAAFALYRIGRERRWPKVDGQTAWLIGWVLAFFAIFSFSRSKLPQYIYPIIPAVSLLAARTWAEVGPWQRPFSRLVGGIALVLAVLLWTFMFPAPVYIWLALVVPLGALAATVSAKRFVEPMPSGPSIIASAFILALLTGWLYPAFNRYKPMAEVAEKVLSWQVPEVRVASLPMASLEFLLPMPVQITSTEGAIAALRQGMAVVVPVELLEQVKAGFGDATEVDGPYEYYPVSLPSRGFILASERSHAVGHIAVLKSRGASVAR